MKTSSNREPLITDYEFSLTAPGCHPGSTSRILHLVPKEDITDVLPYLNAELEDAQYEHEAAVLIWKGKEKKYAFRPKEITVSPLQEHRQADSFCREAISLVNEIWQRRKEIEPDYSKVVLPNLMEIFKQLPRTNCGECGYPTCMAFAAAYREDPNLREKCPHL
jgi:ArsR family metal-binding transcriptional regulator